MSGPERKICWRVTRYCNLACQHCLAGHANANRSDLTRADRLRAADIIAEVGLDRITWTGGEPTLCSDLPDLLRAMRNAGIANTITTHGLSLRDSVLAALDEDRDRLRFSFDGLRSTHNLIRNANVFDRTLSELARMRALGFRVEANLAAMKCNANDLPELTRLLADNGVVAIIVLNLIHRENAVDNHLEALSRDQFEQLVEALRDALLPYASVGLRINNYFQENDSYIILESDGDIVISSELVPDRSYGVIVGDDGAQRLRTALAEQTLRHQEILKKAIAG